MRYLLANESRRGFRRYCRSVVSLAMVLRGPNICYECFLLTHCTTSIKILTSVKHFLSERQELAAVWINQTYGTFS